MKDKSPWKSTAKIETVEVPAVGKFVEGTVATVYAVTDHTDLCKRLRHGFADENYSGKVDSIMEEAADAIAALREQIIELRENIKALDNSLSEANIKRGDAEADNAALREQVENVKAGYTQLLVQRSELEADNAKLRAENESLRAECGLRQIRGYNEGRAAAMLAGKKQND